MEKVMGKDSNNSNVLKKLWERFPMIEMYWKGSHILLWGSIICFMYVIFIRKYKIPNLKVLLLHKIVLYASRTCYVLYR